MSVKRLSNLSSGLCTGVNVLLRVFVVFDVCLNKHKQIYLHIQ